MFPAQRLALAAFLCGLVALGCAEQPAGSTASDVDSIKVVIGPRKKPTEPAKTYSPDNPITGYAKYNTGKTTQPQPKALEEIKEYKGKVVSSDDSSLTVALNVGGQKTFYTDANTQIFNSGDPRFFPKPMPRSGADVTILAFIKDGRDFARTIAIGTRGFDQRNNNDNDNNNDNN